MATAVAAAPSKRLPKRGGEPVAGRLRSSLVSTLDRVSRRFRWLVLLRASLVAGALYDAGFAAAMLFAPQAAAHRLGLPLPAPAFYLSLIAVLLLMLAALYLVAADDPERGARIVAVAIVGRLGGALVLGAAARALPALWPLAAADLAFAAAHAAFWLPWRE